MNLKSTILDFLQTNPGIYTLNDLAYAIGRNPTTNMRHALEILTERGEVSRVPVSSDQGRLAWGYSARTVQPKLF